jgi:nucleolar pre-ribosomal-associated protein 1
MDLAEFSAQIASDIRTLYLLLVLSFVDGDNSTLFKTTFLEQHKDIFLSIFKGLAQDTYPVVLKVLEVCWRGILSDSKLKRTLKVTLFSETTITHVSNAFLYPYDLIPKLHFQIAKLYDRSASEDDEPDHIPADVAHHFLLALCTRPGAGVCFKDRGWYPRDSIDEEHAQAEADQRGGKIHNKILANVLKSLKVNDDPRQQELALKIMAACPELPSWYVVNHGGPPST